MDWSRLHMAVTAACLVLLSGACTGIATRDDAGRSDVVAAVDAGPIREDATTDNGAPAACPAEPNEDCAACFINIGRCCYDDPTIGGQVDALTETCTRSDACVACCNECAARTCEQLVSQHDCPNM